MTREENILNRIKQSQEDFEKELGLDNLSIENQRQQIASQVNQIEKIKEGDNEVFNALRQNPDYFIGDTPQYSLDFGENKSILSEKVSILKPDGTKFETTIGAAFYDIQQNKLNKILLPTNDGGQKEINVEEFQQANFEKAKNLLKDTILEDKIYNPFELNPGLYTSNKNFKSIEEIDEIPSVNGIIGNKEDWNNFIKEADTETLQKLGLNFGTFISGLISVPDDPEEFGLNINKIKQNNLSEKELEQLKKDLLDYNENNLIRTNIGLYGKNNDGVFGFFNPHSFLENLKENFVSTKDLSNKKNIKDIYYKEGNRLFYKNPENFGERWENISNQIDKLYEQSPIGAVVQAIDTTANVITNKQENNLQQEFNQIRQKRIEGFDTGESFTKSTIDYIANLPSQIALSAGNLGLLAANIVSLESIKGVELLRTVGIIGGKPQVKQIAELQSDIDKLQINILNSFSPNKKIQQNYIETTGSIIMPNNLKFKLGSQDFEITGKDVVNFTAGIANTIPLITTGSGVQKKVTDSIINNAKNLNRIVSFTAEAVGSLAGSGVTGSLSALQNINNIQGASEFIEQIGKETVLDFLMFASSSAINKTVSDGFGVILSRLENIQKNNSLIKLNKITDDIFNNSELVNKLKKQIDNNTFKGVASKLGFLNKIKDNKLYNIGYNLASGLVKTSTFILSSQLSNFSFETLVNSIYNNKPTLGGNIISDWNDQEKRAARINELANQIGFGAMYMLAPTLMRDNNEYRNLLINEIKKIGVVSIESNWEDAKNFIKRNIPDFTKNKPNSEALNILGLQQNPDLQEIKQAYYKLANQYHPDKPNGDKSKFIKIKQAYDQLTNGINDTINLPENIRIFVNFNNQKIDIGKSFKDNIYDDIVNNLKQKGIDTKNVTGKITIATANPADLGGLSGYEIARRISDINADGRIFELNFNLINKQGDIENKSIIFGVSQNADGTYKYTSEDEMVKESFEEKVNNIQEKEFKLQEVYKNWDIFSKAKEKDFKKILTIIDNKKYVKTVLKVKNGLINLFGEKVLGVVIQGAKTDVNNFINDWGYDLLSSFKETMYGTISKKQIELIETEPFKFLDSYFKSNKIKEQISLQLEKTDKEKILLETIGNIKNVNLYKLGEKISSLTEKQTLEKIKKGDEQEFINLLSNPILNNDFLIATLPNENGDYININKGFESFKDSVIDSLNIYNQYKNKVNKELDIYKQLTVNSKNKKLQDVYSKQLSKLPSKEKETTKQNPSIPEDANTRTGLQQKDTTQSSDPLFKEPQGIKQEIPDQRGTIETASQDGEVRGKPILAKTSQNSLDTDGGTTNRQPENTRGHDNRMDNTDSSRMGNTLIEKEIVDLVKGKDIDINFLYSIAKNYTRTSENVLLDDQYYTPLIVTDLVWAIAKKYNYNLNKSVLENSAGTGRFLWGIENDNLFFYELNPFSAILAKLLSKGKWLYNQDFSLQDFKESVNNTLENPQSFSLNQIGTLKKILDFTSSGQGTDEKYDFIIGNPPYDNKLLKEFILKSSEILKPEGHLIQILPLSYYKKYYEDIFGLFDNLNLEEVVALPIESFSVNFENLTNHRPAEVQTGIFVFSKKPKENKNVEIKKIGKETEKINRYKQKQTVYTLDIQGTKTKEKVAKEIEKAINNFIQENNLEKLDRKPLNEEEIQKNLEELRKMFSTQTTKTDLGVLPLSLGISNLAEVLYNQNIFVSSFLNSVVDFSIPFTSFSFLESVGKRIKRTGLFSWRLSGTIEKESYLNELEIKRNQILEEISLDVKRQIGTFTTLLSNPVKRGRILETVEKLQDIASNKEKLYGPFIKEAEKVRETENQIDAIFDEFDQKYQLKTQDGEEIATAKLLLSALFLDAKGNLSNKGIVYNTFGAPIIARDKIVSQEFPTKELKKHNERGYYIVIHTGKKITKEQLAQKLIKITEKIEKITVSGKRIKTDLDAINTQKILEEVLLAENLNYRKTFNTKTKKTVYSISKEKVFIYAPGKLKTEDIPRKQFIKATLFNYNPLQAILDETSYSLVTGNLIPEINKIKNKNILYDSNNLAKTINKTIAKNGQIKASAIIRTRVYIYNLPVSEEELSLEQKRIIFDDTEAVDTQNLQQMATDKTILQKFTKLKEGLSAEQIADLKGKGGISRILDNGRVFVVNRINRFLDNKAVSKLNIFYTNLDDIPKDRKKDFVKITFNNIPESIINNPELVLDYTLGKYTNPKIGNKKLKKEKQNKVEYYMPLEIVNNNTDLYSLSNHFSSSVIKYLNKGINAFEVNWLGQLTKTIFSSYLRTVFINTGTVAARFVNGVNSGIQRFAPILVTRLSFIDKKEKIKKLKNNKDLLYEISFDLSNYITNNFTISKYKKYSKEGQNRIQNGLFRGLEILSNVILNDELLDTKTKNTLVNKINKGLNLVLDTFRAGQKVIDPSFIGVLVGDLVTKTSKLKFLGEYDTFIDPFIGFFVDWSEENKKEPNLQSYNEFRKTEEFIDIRDFILRQNGFAKPNKIENFYLKLTTYNANLRSVFFLFNQIRNQKEFYNSLKNYRKILEKGTKRQKYIYTLALANYLFTTLAILFAVNLIFYENEKRLKKLIKEVTPGTKVFKQTVKDLENLLSNKQNFVDIPGVIGGYLYILLKSPFVNDLLNILNLKDIEELSKNPSWLLSDAKIREIDKEILSIIKREKNIGIAVKKETRDLKETILSLIPTYKLLQTIGEVFGFSESEITKEKKEQEEKENNIIIKRSFLQRIIGGVTEEQKEKRIERDRELTKQRKTDVVTQKLLELNNIIAKSEFREETKEEKQKDIKRLEKRFGTDKFEKAKENLGIKSTDEIGQKILIKKRGDSLDFIRRDPGETVNNKKKVTRILKPASVRKGIKTKRLNLKKRFRILRRRAL